MRILSSGYPNDPDASSLFAESLMEFHPYHLWSREGLPGKFTAEIVAVLERTLRRWPDHIGANHLYIHAIEGSHQPERALGSALRLASSAPAAGHLVHMASHVLYRTGEYEKAIEYAKLAEAADTEYLHGPVHNRPYTIGYAEHNLYFLVSAADMAGDYESAHSAAIQLQSDVRNRLKSPTLVEAYILAPLFVLMRFERWQELLSVPNPDTTSAGSTFFWHFARSCAFASTGNLSRAKLERENAASVYRDLSPEHQVPMIGQWKVVHALATAIMDARIAAASGDKESAISFWRSASVAQSELDYFAEPPAWYYPVSESLGAALFRAGRLADAEDVFRQDLMINRRNPRSLYGLSMTLQGEGKAMEAAETLVEFQSGWKDKTQGELRIEDF